MRRNPERLAWTVLSISLIICVGLAITVPLALRSYVNDSTDVASITLEVQQGTALVRRTGLEDPIGVTIEYPNLPDSATIRADPNVQALLTIRVPGTDKTLMTVQIYGNTNLDISRARSPRFQPSTQPYQLHLALDGGRVRVNVAGGLERSIEAQFTTPQATVNLAEGTFAIDVSNDETQVTVRDGQAVVIGQGHEQPLTALQRTVVKLGSLPAGVLSPERNLVSNGNFRQPLEGTWEVSHDLQKPDAPGETPGTVTITTNGGSRQAMFERVGTYHAETDLRQVIDRDVRDFRSLKLHFVVQIIEQDVPVCGQAGSECPMMVRLDYKDANGTDRSYLQGFYWRLDPNTINPDYNTTSGTRTQHKRVQRGFPFTYDSDDLMKLLSPTHITSITFYASGHSYTAAISEVELLGEQ